MVEGDVQETPPTHARTPQFERHRARAQAVLTDMVVNPIFGTFGRYVLKEAMRLYEKTLLYHEAPSSDVVPLHVLETLVPVPARWRATPNPGF